MYYLHILVFFLFSWGEGQTSPRPQEPTDSLVWLQRQAMEHSIVVLKNTHQQMPLKELDSLRICSISLANTVGNYATRRIDAYVESQHLGLKSLTEYNLIERGILSSSNLFIISVDSSDQSIQPYLDIVKQNEATPPIILTINRNSSLLNEAMADDAISGIIWSDWEHAESHDLMIQAIFGGMSVNNVLKDTLAPALPKGYGLELAEQIRLQYTTPDEVGILPSDFDRGISEIAQQGIDSGAYPGCQILVAKDGKVIFYKSYGYHTYDKKRAVVNTDIYDIASVTKVTAATLALMGLYDDGRIELDKPFKDYWPRFNNTNKSEISLRSVLAHHARLRPWIPYYQESRKKNGRYRSKTLRSDSSKNYPDRVSSTLFLHRDYRTKKLYRMIDKSSLNEETGYVYSGLSFYLYPQIVKNLTGSSFDDYLYRNYYNRLGASTIRFHPTKRYDLNRLVPTERDDFFRMELLHGTVHDEGAAVMLGLSGNAGLFANANDLAKIWQMFLNDGAYGGERYLKEETIKEFTSCQFCSEDNRRGLGFDKPLIVYDEVKSSVAKDASPESYGHSGYTGTLVWADPSNGLLFIFLSNRVYPTRDNRKLYQFNIRPRIHDFIYDSFNSIEQ